MHSQELGIQNRVQTAAVRKILRARHVAAYTSLVLWLAANVGTLYAHRATGVCS